MTGDVEYRRTLGAYLLGALEPDEEERLEKHVRSCVPCHAELLGLGRVVADMAVVDTAVAVVGIDETPIEWKWDAAQRATAKNAPGSLRRRLFAVAAAVAGVAAAGGIGFVVGGSDTSTTTTTETPTHPIGTRTARGWSNETDVAGTAILTPADWGTKIQLTITGAQTAAAPGTGCTLLTISRLGTTGQAASWAIPASPPTPGGERIGGSTAIPMHQLLMLLVVTDYGRPLLTVPIT